MGALCRVALLIALIAATPAALAQPAPTSARWDAPRFEMGLRYWATTGKQKWGVDRRPLDPAAGNPTEALNFDDLSAHVAELHWRAKAGQRWFLKGNFGAGHIHSGTLHDELFIVDQIKVGDFTSSVSGKGLVYSTFDIGRDVWGSAQSNAVIAIFTGYHQWIERANAYGASNTPGFPVTVTELGNTTPLVSNEVTWYSWRLGLEARSKWGDRARAIAEIAFVPYTRAKGEVSAFQRQDPADLGSVPNIHNKGSGHGVQFDLDVRYSVFRSTELGAGFRMWRLYTTHGTESSAQGEFALRDMESYRVGFSLSLTQRF